MSFGFRSAVLFLLLIGWQGNSPRAAEPPTVAVVDFYAVVKGLDKFATLFSELKKTRNELRQCEAEHRAALDKQRTVDSESAEGKELQATIKELTDKAAKLRETIKPLMDQERAAYKDYHNPIIGAAAKVAGEEGIDIVLSTNGNYSQIVFYSQRANINSKVIKKLNESAAQK